MEPLFTVDEARCTRCGACARACPVAIVQQVAPKAVPTPAAHAAYCIGCGHCMASCPRAALRLASAPRGKLRSASEPSPRTFAAVRDLVLSRRSVRFFTPRPVARKALARLIDAARYAPTGGNAEEVEWIVLDGSAQVRRVTDLVVQSMRKERAKARGDEAAILDTLLAGYDAGADPICRGAPALVLAHCDAKAMTGACDCALAVGSFDLLATASGLGTCWAGFVQMTCEYPPLRRFLGVPKGHQVHAVMMVGHPGQRFFFVPPRKPARIQWGPRG